MQKNLIIENSFLITELIEHLSLLRSEEYSLKVESISNSSIGEHIRHIINFFESFLNSFDQETMNYDRRIRDPRLELEKDFAIEKLQKISMQMNSLSFDGSRPLLLETSSGIIYSNLSRELHYINEHTIHHMAIIRIFFLQSFPQYSLDSSFGYSSSTLHYLNSKNRMAEHSV